MYCHLSLFDSTYFGVIDVIAGHEITVVAQVKKKRDRSLESNETATFAGEQSLGLICGALKLAPSL